MYISKNDDFRNIYLTSAYTDPEPISSLLKAVALDKIKKHQVVDDPDLADIILFVENSRYHDDYFFSQLRNHPLVKKYPGKVFMYNAHDQPWLVLPGLYASMTSTFFNKDFITATPYIETINPYIKYDDSRSPEFLFSFTGSPNSPPRRKILKLSHPRGIIKAFHGNMFGHGNLKNLKVRYAESLAQSKFILCPRGAGTSSFRIFETMQAGRVPVIVSDQWVAPNGPDWDSFAIFINENDVGQIPEILAAEEINWPQKSALARKEWETFFAPDVIFNYIIENIISLKDTHSSVSLSSRIFHVIPFLKYAFRALVIQNVKMSVKFLTK